MHEAFTAPRVDLFGDLRRTFQAAVSKLTRAYADMGDDVLDDSTGGGLLGGDLLDDTAKQEAKDYIRDKCKNSDKSLDDIIANHDNLKDIDKQFLIKHCGDVRQEYSQGDPGCETMCTEKGKCKVNPLFPDMCCDESNSWAEACAPRDGTDRPGNDDGCSDACRQVNMCFRSSRFNDADGKPLCCLKSDSNEAQCRAQSAQPTADSGCEVPCRDRLMCKRSARFTDTATKQAFCCVSSTSDYKDCRLPDGTTRQQTPDVGCETPCRERNMCKNSTRFPGKCCREPGSGPDKCRDRDGSKPTADSGCEVPCRDRLMCKRSAKFTDTATRQPFCCLTPTSDYKDCRLQDGTTRQQAPDRGCDAPCKKYNFCKTSNRFTYRQVCCRDAGSDYDKCRNTDGTPIQQFTPDRGCEVPCKKTNMCKTSTRFTYRQVCCHTPGSDYDGCRNTDGTPIKQFTPDRGCEFPCKKYNMCKKHTSMKDSAGKPLCCQMPWSNSGGCWQPDKKDEADFGADDYDAAHAYDDAMAPARRPAALPVAYDDVYEFARV